MKIHLVSLGCPKNRVDSELMLGQLQGDGHSLTQDPEEADILIVNTCAFIESAKEESVDTILEMAEYKAMHDERKLIVTGCMAQRYGNELQAAMPEVDTFLGTRDFDRIRKAIAGTLPERAYINPGSYLYSSSDARTNTVRGGTAYIKISEGCNRTCSFCIIPSIRGKQVSRPVDDIIKEARRLAYAGVQEVVLIAQDMTSYGVDFGDKTALIKLLNALDKVDGLRWVRMLYMYPWNFTDELLDTMLACDKVLPYVDMPLQHISSDILKLMRRNTTRKRQRELLRRLRDIPGMVLRTTFITGFPGETDEHFRELYDWVEEVRFDRVGVFAFSQEENTRAATLPNQVPQELREERRDLLMELQHGISLDINRALIGQRLQVLVDGISKEHELVYEGRYYGQAPDIDGCVYLSYEDGGSLVTPGDFVEVEIEDATAYDLVGVVLPEAPILLSSDGTLRINTTRVEA